MEDRTRFTTEQVLRGIQAYVDEQFGEPFPLDPDASISVYYDTVRQEMGCPLEFLTELGWFFGLTWNESRWSVWLRLPRPKKARILTTAEGKQLWNAWLTETSQPLTIRKLAGYIARHARGCCMQPATVFGVPCASAGAFLGLRDLLEVGGTRVAPSTKLRDVIRGRRLRLFWAKSRWVSGKSVPDLAPAIGKNGFERAVGVSLFIVLAGLVGMSGMTLFQWNLSAAFPVFLAAIVLPGILLYWLELVVDSVRNPLPVGVETFGDLAGLIAERNSSTAH